MIGAYRDEAALGEFIKSTWPGYEPDGDVQEIEQSDGSIVGITIKDGWKMVDTYHTNPTETVFNGREVVYLDAVPVWAANYHSVIPDPNLAKSVLDFFFTQVAANPDPDFPVTGVQGLEDGNFRLRYESLLGGRLSLAQFAVRDVIEFKPTNTTAMFSHTVGGWIN